MILFVLIAPVLVRAADKTAAAAKPKQTDYYILMEEFVTAFEQIERNYVKGVDRRELLEAAIKGMIAKLDPYSSYISPKDMARFKESVDQQYGGIGIQVHIDETTKRLTVTSPLPGTPAFKAGIRAGDVIEEIEGKSTKGFSTRDAAKIMRGKAGDPVTIGIRHAGSKKIIRIRLVRADIKTATVLGDYYNADGTWNMMIDGKRKIGYVRLTSFGRRSANELKSALQKLKKQGLRGLILDLRNNPGGLLSQATRISDLFIEKGRIVSTKGKNSPERVWNARKAGTFSGFPMVVLVNRFSASASEIVSACLQDHKRAVIVGERTWGKGSVQNVIPILGGRSAIKLTTASYHRPSGKNIHKSKESKSTDEWGVTPEKPFRIRFTRQELKDYRKYRNLRDVLSNKGPPTSKFKDRQMAKAREYLIRLLDKSAKSPAKNSKGAAAAKKPQRTSAPAAGTRSAIDSRFWMRRAGGQAVQWCVHFGTEGTRSERTLSPPPPPSPFFRSRYL
ncbi:MAG: S41 family peptidase [Planctomycetes bacterium]|nr:S41 family peptidase [Planctomycetota bacterium]